MATAVYNIFDALASNCDDAINTERDLNSHCRRSARDRNRNSGNQQTRYTVKAAPPVTPSKILRWGDLDDEDDGDDFLSILPPLPQLPPETKTGEDKNTLSSPTSTGKTLIQRQPLDVIDEEDSAPLASPCSSSAASDYHQDSPNSTRNPKSSSPSSSKRKKKSASKKLKSKK